MNELIDIAKALVTKLREDAGGRYDGPVEWMDNWARGLQLALQKAERELREKK